MKKIFLKTLLFGCVFLLFNCQEDDALEADDSKAKMLIITSERVSYENVVSQIRNTNIKDVSQEITRNQNSSLAQRTSQEELQYFDKIVKGEEYTTYSLQLSTYSQATPYFMYYIITQNSITEKAGYVKYIPEAPVSVLDMKAFTGIIELYDITTAIVVKASFINGIEQDEEQHANANARTVGADGCVTTVRIITHNCTNGGNHPPGTSCAEGETNDGYYEIVTTVVCPELHQNNSIRVPDQFMGGGSSGGGTAVPPYPFQFLLTKFTNSLSLKQGEWWLSSANATSKQAILTYLEDNYFSEESKVFAKEMIDVLNTTEFENEAEKLATTKVLIYTQQNDYFNQNLDVTFFTTVTSYSQLDSTDPVILMNMARMFLVHCATLKQENPNWSDAKILGQAYLDTVHLIGDLGGLVPVIGEVADLANGTLYLIEGDGVNASLSYASAIPIAGWFSAGIKFAKRADGLKFLVVGTNNLITFGAANSKKIRAACGIAVGDATKQAHHIIPRGSQILEHPVVQRAAQANVNQGFHIDQTLNGIAVATWRNQPNHTAYNNLIRQKLINFLAENPNATPQQCYTFLTNLIQQAKQAIINNPNVHLNNLNF